MDLGITSGNGKYATEGILDSTLCTYGYSFSLKAAVKSTIRTPCTNRPVRCKVCKCVFWSYNIMTHYALNHSHLTCEETCHPSEGEIANVKKSKY